MDQDEQHGANPQEPAPQGGDAPPASATLEPVGAAAPPPIAPPPTAPAAYTPPPIPPPAPGVPESPTAPGAAQEPKGSPLKRLGAIGVVVAGALGVIIWKFVLPIVLVGVAGGVFGSAFGGPYNRLAADVRSGFEDRFKAAVGPTFEQQSDEEQKAKVVALVTNGLPRLSDAQIETNFRLSVKGMQAVDTASCTAIAKAFFSGTEPPDSAFTALVGTLTDAELQQWFEIRLQAIEAETRGSPPAVLISDATVDPLYERLVVAMDPADVDTLVSMSNGATIEDARMCPALRGLYGSVLTLASADVLLFARYDVTP